MWASSIQINYYDYRESFICRINEVFVFSIKYRCSDILLKKKHNFHLNRLFCCHHTCFRVNMVSLKSTLCNITSASRYHPRYHNRSSMHIRGLIPRNFAELALTVPIVFKGLRIAEDNRIFVSPVKLG